MKLTFLGATGTVTGSKYLIEHDDKKILVDCGLFQGYKALRLRNWAAMPFNPADLDAVLLTHAHIDHSGYLPLLIKNGFKGRIYATGATTALCKVLLPDSGHLHEEDARLANLHGFSKHHPALPLYTREDGEAALKHFVSVNYHQPLNLFPGFSVNWLRAGHILGSALIEIKTAGKTVLFSGDLGRTHDPIMKPADSIEQTDYLIIESTYGNRLHEKTNPETLIAKVVNETAKHGGTIVIPAFAVGRAQSMLYYLYQLKQKNQIPDIPIFLDSPMAIDATEVLHHFADEHQLSPNECQAVCRVAAYVNTPDESKALDQIRMPKVIISASGMMTGGRILHHLKEFAPDPRNTILLTGFQAGGTRGARLLAGEKELKIHGAMIPVRATIEAMTNLSAHADYEEILAWLKQFKRPPQTTFITHGEPEAALALKGHIEETLGWHCVIPEYRQCEMLA